MHPVRVFSILIGSLFVFTCSASPFFWDHHRGWHWYELLKKPEKEKQKSVQRKDPIQALNQLQQSLETAKATAIMQPTETNLKTYIELQNQVAQQSSIFAEQWQRVLWKYPELDYSLVKPTGLLAKQTYLDDRKTEIQKTVQAFAKTHGLWFFFRSNCPYCHHFAPILKQFAEQYGFQVLAVSVDGGTLSEFPTPQFNQGQAEKLKVTSVPALFSVNPKTQEIQPVGYGLMTLQELEERIWALSQTNLGGVL